MSSKNFLERSQIENLAIFSELDLGNEGFGKPDGAFRFDYGAERYFFFVEGKFNETYRKSCKNKSYNSTIQGQIELKMRFINRVFQPNIESLSYISEDGTIKDFYKEKDIFYKKRPTNTGGSSFRRLWIKDGVKRLIEEYIQPCSLENIFYLVITCDGNSPFESLEIELRPSFPDRTWEEIKQQLCWISAESIENL